MTVRTHRTQAAKKRLLCKFEQPSEAWPNNRMAIIFWTCSNAELSPCEAYISERRIRVTQSQTGVQKNTELILIVCHCLHSRSIWTSSINRNSNNSQYTSGDLTACQTHHVIAPHNHHVTDHAHGHKRTVAHQGKESFGKSRHPWSAAPNLTSLNRHK